jgi:hypothetical protein
LDTDSSTDSSSSDDRGAKDDNDENMNVTVKDDNVGLLTESMGWPMNVAMGDVETQHFLKNNYCRILIS